MCNKVRCPECGSYEVTELRLFARVVDEVVQRIVDYVMMNRVCVDPRPRPYRASRTYECKFCRKQFTIKS